jgi:hypothetical protein
MLPVAPERLTFGTPSPKTDGPAARRLDRWLATWFQFSGVKISSPMGSPGGFTPNFRVSESFSPLRRIRYIDIGVSQTKPGRAFFTSDVGKIE